MTPRAIPLALLLGLVACGSTSPSSVPRDPIASSGAAAALPPADCVNPPPDVTTLIEQAERAACYGSAELTVPAHAVLVQGAIDCPGRLEPGWLGCAGVMIELYELPETSRAPAVVLAARSPQRGGALFAVVHPGYHVDLSRGLDTAVTATGHFDDPAAQSCHYTSWPDANPPADAEVVDRCRSTFVITHLEPLQSAAGPALTPRPSATASSALAAGTVAHRTSTIASSSCAAARA